MARDLLASAEEVNLFHGFVELDYFLAAWGLGRCTAVACAQFAGCASLLKVFLMVNGAAVIIVDLRLEGACRSILG